MASKIVSSNRLATDHDDTRGLGTDLVDPPGAGNRIRQYQSLTAEWHISGTQHLFHNCYSLIFSTGHMQHITITQKTIFALTTLGHQCMQREWYFPPLTSQNDAMPVGCSQLLHPHDSAHPVPQKVQP